jgi:hypothetical protein
VFVVLARQAVLRPNELEVFWDLRQIGGAVFTHDNAMRRDIPKVVIDIGKNERVTFFLVCHIPTVAYFIIYVNS